MTRRPRLAAPPDRQRREAIVPMINVVFLLLVFFLMTAQIAPPPPFEIAPPVAEATAPPADGPLEMWLSAEGEAAFGAARGPTALAALAEARAARCAGADCDASPPGLVLRADAGTPAAALAALMPRLAGAGFARIDLVTAAP